MICYYEQLYIRFIIYDIESIAHKPVKVPPIQTYNDKAILQATIVGFKIPRVFKLALSHAG